MPDVLFGDDIKKSIRLASWWLRKEYGKSQGDIHNDVVNSGNPIIREIYKITLDAATQINRKHQRSVTIDYPELGLWILYKDTAYRQIFFYILKKLMDKKDELMPFINEYYVEPQDWYVNKWAKSKEKTAELIKDGKIPDCDGFMSIEESYWTPGYQQERFVKILNEMGNEVNIEKKKRRW